MSTQPTPSALTKKLAVILGSVGKIMKKGHNTHFNYKFVRETDLVEAVRDKLADQHIFITSSVKKTEVIDMSKVLKSGEVVVMRVGLLYVEYTFRDGETGETFTVEGIGEIEQDGGKGIYKAITGAMKYMLMKNFLIDTGDDPEADSRQPAQKPQGASKPSGGSQTPERGYPATNAQKNCISRVWNELTPAEQDTMKNWMQSKGIKSEGMTKRQASSLIDEMQAAKQKRQPAAKPVVPKGAPAPVQDPAPSAEQIEEWAASLREQPTLFELNTLWFKIKPLPMQAHQQKYLQDVRDAQIKFLNSPSQQ